MDANAVVTQYIDTARQCLDFSALLLANAAYVKSSTWQHKQIDGVTSDIAGGLTLASHSMADIFSQGDRTATHYTGVMLTLSETIIEAAIKLNHAKDALAIAHSAYLKTDKNAKLNQMASQRLAQANEARRGELNNEYIKPRLFNYSHIIRKITIVGERIESIGFYPHTRKKIERVSDKYLTELYASSSDHRAAYLQERIESAERESLRFVFESKGCTYRANLKKRNGNWLNMATSLPILIVGEKMPDIIERGARISLKARIDAGEYREVLPELGIYEKTR